MTPEQKLYQWLRDQIPGDIVRIENVVGNGLPDVNICYNGCDVWVELKSLESHRVLLRPEQFAWSMRRSSHGGSCFVVNRDPQRDIIDIWRFPDVNGTPAGKYVRINSPPHQRIDIDGKQLRKVLFPMF